MQKSREDWNFFPTGEGMVLRGDCWGNFPVQGG